MKLKNIIILSFLLILFHSQIFAQSASTLNVIGFSKDGNYLAYERYTEEFDPSGGFIYSEIFIVNVPKNQYVTKPIITKSEFSYDDKDSSPDLNLIRNKTLKKTSAQLKRFRIIKGNTGKLLVYHLITDLTPSHPFADQGKKESKVKFTLNGEGWGQPLLQKEEPYELILKQFESKGGILFQLKLVRDKKSKILQKDKKLPKSRGFVSAYRIERVYVYKNRIVVFLNCWIHSSEVHNIRHLAVTGTLDFSK